MKRTLQIANGIALVATIIINYLSNTGMINNTTIGEVSNVLTNLFTPAGYAFSIWGLIYLLLIGFIFYQGRSLFSSGSKTDDVVLNIGWWFVISCIANSSWVFLWLYGETGASCFFILVLLFSLIQIIYKCGLSLEEVSFTRTLFVSWPFVIYAGWVTVASIANLAAYLYKTNWDRWGFKPETWAIVLIIAAVIINVRVLYNRNLRAFALVGAWALVAIGIRNEELHKDVTYVAFAGVLILLLNVGYHAFLQYKKSATAQTFTKSNAS